MRKLQTQGVHHITLVGADRQSTIDFWEGVLGMPFVFEQPNLDRASESHLYFDPGDGRLITIFTDEGRKAANGMREQVHRAEKTWMEVLTPKEQEKLIQLLWRVQDRLQEHP